MQSPNTDDLLYAVDPEPVDPEPAATDPVDREPWWHTAVSFAMLIAFAAITLTATAGILYAIWWAISTALHGLSSLGEGAAKSTPGIIEPVVRTITDPVHHYIHTHAHGLPIPAEKLWWAWIVAVAGFFIAATLGVYGARIGWLIIGVITIAMVRADAAPNNQLLAAGITAGIWAVLSVVALNQLGNDDPDPDTRVVVIRPDTSDSDIEP